MTQFSISEATLHMIVGLVVFLLVLALTLVFITVQVYPDLAHWSSQVDLSFRLRR